MDPMAFRLSESGIYSGWKVECLGMVKKMGMDAALKFISGVSTGIFKLERDPFCSQLCSFLFL